jgi:hypothetical protein
MTQITDIFHSHEDVEISARIYPYHDDIDTVPRVLALLRPATP